MKEVQYNNQYFHLFLISACLLTAATIFFSTGDSKLFGSFVHKKVNFLLICFTFLFLSLDSVLFIQSLHFMFSLSPLSSSLYSLAFQGTEKYLGFSFSFKAISICLGFFSILDNKPYLCPQICSIVFVLSLAAISGQSLPYFLNNFINMSSSFYVHLRCTLTGIFLRTFACFACLCFGSDVIYLIIPNTLE